MSKNIETGKAGQLFEDFLREQGAYEETAERAIKRVIAFQLAQAMKENSLSKVAMAKRLETSRSQLDRLLDPDNGNVTLATLACAAEVVGRLIKLELV
ncbi:MAG: helix-turn-helix domain-containing protein [Rhizobiaceae bacterium]|nr:helix-turn-helix domain-containing protein [Rhizobiaceae bacterium]